MLKFEELIIIDILRNKDIKVIKETYGRFNIDYNEVIKLAINQKIFRYISKSLCYIIEDQKELINFYDLMIKDDISKRTQFFLKVLKNFNDYNIDYVVIKGFVLGYLIYNFLDKRSYSDLDLIIREEDYFRAIESLVTNDFEIISYDIINEIKKDEYKVIIKYENNNYTIEFKFQHRFLELDLLEEKNRTTVNINDIHIKTNTCELNLISQLIYINYYFNNPNSIINDNKLIIRYHVDLYNYLIKHLDLFNYEYLKCYIKEYININDFIRIIKELYTIFNDYSLVTFLNKILHNNINLFYEIESNVIFKTFRNTEYKHYFINYYFKNIVLKESINKNNKSFIVRLNRNIKGIICYDDFILKIHIILKALIKTNDLLVIFKLFYKNEYNDFIYPYDCYTLLLSDFPRIYNSFTFEKGKYEGIYCKEKELDNVFGKKIFTIYGSPNNFRVEFNFQTEKWFQFFNNLIGINIEFWEKDNEKIFLIDKISNDYEPMKFMIKAKLD